MKKPTRLLLNRKTIPFLPLVAAGALPESAGTAHPTYNFQHKFTESKNSSIIQGKFYTNKNNEAGNDVMPEAAQATAGDYKFICQNVQSGFVNTIQNQQAMHFMKTEIISNYSIIDYESLILILPKYSRRRHDGGKCFITGSN